MGLTGSELIEQLADKIHVRVRSHGGLRLIAYDDCEKIVEACRGGSYLILGIEAFRVTKDSIVPETDLIADFSELLSIQWDQACLAAASSAESYFSETKGRSELWFDFSLRHRQ